MLRNQIVKYYNLMSEFGLKITIYELSLRLIGIIFGRNSKRWKKASKRKYDYIFTVFEEDFTEIIDKYKKRNEIPKVISNDSPIWIFWAQGLEAAPEIVKQCIKSINKYSGNHPVNILDLSNYETFVSLDDNIKNKYKKGIISTPHFADIIRFKLLSEHGGIWCDATIFFSKDLSELFLDDYSWFSIKHNIGTDYLACRGKWTTFFIASANNNIISSFVCDVLCEYWKRYNFPIDYLFLDSIIYLAYMKFDEAKKQIEAIPVNNTNVFEAMLSFERMDDKNVVEGLIERNSISKLTYKIKNGEEQTKLMKEVMSNYI